MNLGQILELHLGLAANSLNYQAIVPAICRRDRSRDPRRAQESRLSTRTAKCDLYDGRTGEQFEQDIAVGYMYILKLHHMVEDKIHMRSIGPYSLMTQQPLGGKAQGGGQRFGEMEVWALLGYGAAYTLREMLTIKSDDIMGRSAAFDAIVRGERINHHYAPASFNVLASHTCAVLALDVELMRGRLTRYTMLRKTPGAEASRTSTRCASAPHHPRRILEWSHGEVTKPETINYRTQRPEKNASSTKRSSAPKRITNVTAANTAASAIKGIICEKCGVEITRAIVRRERMGHVDLAVPVAHVWFLRAHSVAPLDSCSASPPATLRRSSTSQATSSRPCTSRRKTRITGELEAEYKQKIKNLQDDKSKDKMKELFFEAKRDIESHLCRRPSSTKPRYHRYAIKYGAMFEAGIGAEALYDLLQRSQSQRDDRQDRSKRWRSAAPRSAKSFHAASRPCAACYAPTCAPSGCSSRAFRLSRRACGPWSRSTAAAMRPPTSTTSTAASSTATTA